MSRRSALALIGLVTVTLLGLALLLIPSGAAGRGPAGSTHSTMPSGAKALFLTIKELGLPTTRFTKRFRSLKTARGVLVIVGPLSASLTRGDASDLTAWLSQGNIAIIAGSAPVSGPARSGEKDPMDTIVPPRKGNNTTPVFGLETKIADLTARERVSVDSSDLAGVSSVSVSAGVRWKSAGGDWRTLVADRRGPILIEKRFGPGRLFALSDERTASNRFISEADNLKLILAMALKDGRPERILFDEYHHGFISGKSPVGIAASSVFSWALLQIALGLMLLWYSSRAKQAGRFAEPARPQGRPALGYVDAMGNVFETCKASSIALEAVLARFLRVTAGKTRGVKRANSDEQRGATRSLDLVLAQCRDALKSEDDPERAVRAAQALARERISAKQRLGAPRAHGAAQDRTGKPT